MIDLEGSGVQSWILVDLVDGIINDSNNVKLVGGLVIDWRYLIEVSKLNCKRPRRKPTLLQT